MLLHSDIPLSFALYLTDAGYIAKSTGKFCATFTRDHVQVVIVHLKMFVNTEYIQDKAPIPLGEHFIFEGIDKLNFLGWVFILHACNAISLQEVLKKITAKEIGVLLQTLSGAKGFFGILHDNLEFANGSLSIQ